jgi:hypothetical protein
MFKRASCENSIGTKVGFGWISSILTLGNSIESCEPSCSLSTGHAEERGESSQNYRKEAK